MISLCYFDGCTSLHMIYNAYIYVSVWWYTYFIIYMEYNVAYLHNLWKERFHFPEVNAAHTSGAVNYKCHISRWPTFWNNKNEMHI